MDSHRFVGSKNKVAVGDRLKDYNMILTDVCGFLERACFSFHGVIRDWSAVFFNETYYVLHTFLKDKPADDCIPQDSNLKWDMILESGTDAASFFSFLERVGFRLMVPVMGCAI